MTRNNTDLASLVIAAYIVNFVIRVFITIEAARIECRAGSI